MGKQNFLFITFCMVLITGLMLSYFKFKEYFSPHRDDFRKITQLKQTVEEKDLAIAALQSQLIDFHQEVAAQIPALKRIEKIPRTFQMRNLASVTQTPTESFEMSGALSEKARAEFRSGDFKASANRLSKLVQKYPTSPVVVEAYFFWGESLFMTGQHPECLDVVDQMMTLFPEHELTGFLMLRMGQILQSRNRGEEASEVYRIVKQNFSFNSELKLQAQKLSETVEL